MRATHWCTAAATSSALGCQQAPVSRRAPPSWAANVARGSRPDSVRQAPHLQRCCRARCRCQREGWGRGEVWERRGPDQDHSNEQLGPGAGSSHGPVASSADPGDGNRQACQQAHELSTM